MTNILVGASVKKLLVLKCCNYGHNSIVSLVKQASQAMPHIYSLPSIVFVQDVIYKPPSFVFVHDVNCSLRLLYSHTVSSKILLRLYSSTMSTAVFCIRTQCHLQSSVVCIRPRCHLQSSVRQLYASRMSSTVLRHLYLLYSQPASMK